MFFTLTMKIELTDQQKNYVETVMGLTTKDKCLSRLCKRKHYFLDTQKSLASKSGGCYACNMINQNKRRLKKDPNRKVITTKIGSKNSCIPLYLVEKLNKEYSSTINFQLYYFGTLCKNKHNIINTGCSLRNKKRGECYACTKDKNNNRRKSEKARETRKLYYKNNKEKIREQVKLRYIKNGGKTEAAREAHRRYEARNLEKIRKQQKEYDLAHPEKRLERSLRRYYRIKSKQESIPESFYCTALGTFAVYTEDEDIDYFACAYCKNKISRKDKTLHWDHVIPVIRGGDHSKNNLLPTCADCNMRKHVSDPLEWYKKQKFFDTERLDEIQRFLNREFLGNFKKRVIDAWK